MTQPINPYFNGGVYSQGTTPEQQAAATPDQGSSVPTSLGGGLASFLGATNSGPGAAPSLGGSPGAFQAAQTLAYGQQYGLSQAAQAAMQNPAAQANYGQGYNPQAAPGSADAMAYQGAQAIGGVQSAADLAGAAAMGGAPSAAQLQQTAGIGQAARQQMAIAASARGGAGQQAAAAQQAGMQGSAMMAQGVGQNAQLRAAEMAQARQQYLGGTQAVGAMTQQAQQMAAQQAQAQAALQAQQNQINSSYSLGLGNTGLGYGGLANSQAGQQLGAATSNQGLAAAAAAQNAQMNEQMAMGAISAAGAGLGTVSDIRAKTDIQPQGGQWKVDMQPAQMEAPQPQAPPPMGMDKASALAFLKGEPMPQQPWQVQMQPAQQIQPLYSDERLKDGGQQTGGVADAYLDHLARSAATYSYKDPSQAPANRPAGAKFGGVMAQDLQSVPEIGQQLVTDTPQGKTLEGGANLSASLMGLGRLHERLKALEARLGGK